MEKVEVRKTCQYCRHGMHAGMHCVAIKCDVDGKEMFGYSAENEYRKNAESCQNFEANRQKVWSNTLQKLVSVEDVEWV